MSSLAELQVSVIGDISNIRSAFADLESRIDGFGKSMQSMGSRMQSMGTSMSLAVTAPLTAMGGLAFKTAVDFDDAMRKVQAVSGATGEEFDQLTALARELGATTAFSATDAAAGMQYLAMAGFDVGEIMASTGDMLALASAGSLDLGAAADIASNVLTGFGLSASEAGRVADVLAKSASSSNTNVQQLGEAMSYVAPLAAAMGMSMEEAAALIGKMSDAGIQGSRAGTALRGAMSRLASPTDQMAIIFGKYNIALDKVNPATNSFTEILGVLEAAGMSASDAMAIFGQEAGPGILALLSVGTEAINEQTLALQNSEGAAKQMAETMEGGTGGALRELQSAFEDLQITIGDLIATAILPLTDRLIAVFNWMSSLPTPVLTLVVALAGLAAAIGPVLVVAGTLISSIGAITTAIAGAGGLSAVLTTVVGILTGPVAIAIAAFAAAAYIVYKNWDTVGPLVQRTFDTIVNAVRPTAEVIMDFVNRACASLSAWWSTNGPAIMQAVGRVSDFLISMFGAMAAVIWYFTSGPLKGLWEAFQQAVNIIIPILDYLGQQVGNMVMLVVNLINGNWSGAWTNARNIVSTAWEAIKSIVSAGLNAILGFHISILNSIYSHIQSIWNSIRSYISGVLNGISSDTTGTWNRILSIITGVLNSIYSAISSILSRVTSLWSSQFDGLSSIASSAMSAVARAISGSGSSLASAASSAGQKALDALSSKLKQMQAMETQMKSIQSIISSSSSSSSSKSSSSGGKVDFGGGVTGSAPTAKNAPYDQPRQSVKREKHDTGGIAGYTGWHWMEEGELAIPKQTNWDKLLVKPIVRALSNSSGPVSAGNIIIQNMPVTLTSSYNFEQLMSDIERYNSQKRFQRGISL